jgi:hypothetical protein
VQSSPRRCAASFRVWRAKFEKALVNQGDLSGPFAGAAATSRTPGSGVPLSSSSLECPYRGTDKIEYALPISSKARESLARGGRLGPCAARIRITIQISSAHARSHHYRE